jgi:hypothetical protein
MISFEVSDVPTRRDPLPPATLQQCVDRLAEGVVDAVWSDDADAPFVQFVHSEGHPFIDAARLAFAHHLPLEFGPDEVWSCIAQGVATHLKLHTETLRSFFVTHTGRKTISLRRDDFRRELQANNWAGFFEGLSREIDAGLARDTAHESVHEGVQPGGLLVDFSTTRPARRTAMHLVSLGALSGWYDYACITLCGIPRITLHGTPQDWELLRRRLDRFYCLGLPRWVGSMAGVVDQLVASSRGEIDTGFWRSFFKLDDQSGGPFVSGWINALFPYTMDCTLVDDRARWVMVPQANAYAEFWDATRPRSRREGPACHEYGSGLAPVAFDWEFMGRRIPMQAFGGFVGVVQDERTLALRPSLGWAIRDGELAAQRRGALHAQGSDIDPHCRPKSAELAEVMRAMH